MAGRSKSAWICNALAGAAWLAVVGVVALAGAAATYYLVGITVRAWLRALPLPYPLAVTAAFVLAAATLTILFRLVVRLMPQPETGAKRL